MPINLFNIKKIYKLIYKVLKGKKTINKRHGGQLRGLIEIRNDFDAALPDDLLKQFNQDNK